MTGALVGIAQDVGALNAVYGLLWWVNRKGRLGSTRLATTGRADTVSHGRMVPGAPADTFWALGLNNQILTVIPSKGVVAVRLGPRPPADTPFDHFHLTRGLLRALR